MSGRTKKATFNISTEILEELDAVMAQGAARSKNALVEQALIRELKELKKQTRREEWQKAAADPLFIRDIEDTEKAFYTADSDSARRIG